MSESGAPYQHITPSIGLLILILSSLNYSLGAYNLLPTIEIKFSSYIKSSFGPNPRVLMAVLDRDYGSVKQHWSSTA